MNYELNKVCDIAVLLGLLATMVLAALPLLGVTVAPWMRVAYAVAAGAVLLARLLTVRSGTGGLRERRLRVLLVVAAALICVSAWLLFRRDSGPTDWVAFLLAGAIMQGYASFMLDRIENNRSNDASNAKKI
ncbi:MAG: hypothetical protein IJU62_05050 [Muribaculaceae bacterium]|nr:hypothetical protein [Muribaculaceae bacterium]